MLVRSIDRSSPLFFEPMAKRPPDGLSGGRLLYGLPTFKKTLLFFAFALAKTELVC
jgi:hypothetical protein